MLELNKIHLGDSYELIKQIPDKSVDLIYTDVPYLYGSGSLINENSSEINKRIVKNQMDDLHNIRDGIDYSIYDEFMRIMKKPNIFIWCSKMQILDTMNYFCAKGLNFQILTWNKTNPTPMCNGNWLPDIEYCLYFSKGVKLNDGYELKSKWYSSSLNKKDKDLYKHPTIKPLDLVKRHILHATQPGDIIFEPFNGSGTTCVASKETGRQFIGIEIDPNYHAISVDRLNGITIQDRKNKENGIISIFDMEEMQ